MYSPRTFLSVFFISSVLWAPIWCQRQINFFYSPQNDTCAYGGQSYAATDNSNNGGLCAWSPADSRVYICPAPDPKCWAWDQTCSGGATAAGPGQILCESGSYSWCCLNTETCTVTEGQINICISDFSSPNSGVNADTAENAELQALGVASVGTSAETASPSIISTRIVDSTGALYSSTSSTSSSTKVSKTSASGSKTGGASASATSSHTPITTSSIPPVSSGSGISSGAIAGIVIAVFLAFAIGAIAIWAIMRRRKHAIAPPTNEAHHHAVEKDGYFEYTTPATKTFARTSTSQYQHQQPVHEADASNMVRPELPSEPSRSELP